MLRTHHPRHVRATTPAPRARRDHRAGLTAAVLSLLLLAACGTGDSSASDGPPEVTSFPEVTQDSALPLDAYILSLGERAELKDLYRELLTRCARQYGGDPVVIAPGTEDLVADSQMWGGRLGTMTMEHAASLGYHAGPDDPVVPYFGIFGNEGEEPLTTILYGADREVVGEQAPEGIPDVPGLPAGGCAGEVDAELGGDPLSTVPEDLDQMRLQAYRDDRTQDAVRAWSTCMRDAGFDFDAVDGPVDLYGDGRPVSEEEISVAVADVRCTRSSKWRDISFAIEKAYQERELREDPDRWAEVKENADSIYRNARTMVTNKQG